MYLVNVAIKQEQCEENEEEGEESGEDDSDEEGMFTSPSTHSDSSSSTTVELK